VAVRSPESRGVWRSRRFEIGAPSSSVSVSATFLRDPDVSRSRTLRRVADEFERALGVDTLPERRRLSALSSTGRE
jgi:hypothetical protein